MTTPVTKVEFGFTQSGGDYVYSDITSYVRNVEINRGIQRNLDLFGAGSASVTVSNNNREFDPYYTSILFTSTNLITNPSFEVNTTNWTTTNGTIARAATITGVSGSYLCELTVGASGTQSQLSLLSATNFTLVPVTAGTAYTASIYARDVNTSRNWAVYIEWRTASSVVSTTTGVFTAINTTSWARLSATGTAPATAIFARVYAISQSAATNGTKAQFDAAMMNTGSTLLTYFDGSTTSTAQNVYAWAGTAHNSTSTFTQRASKFGAEVKPQAAIRITSDGVRIFTGWVDNWQFDYQPGGDSTATINALDGIARLTSAQLNGYTPTAQLSNLRFADVLNRSEVAWSATARNIDAGVITLGTTPVAAGTTAWDYLQQIAQSEGGVTYVDASGNVTLRTQKDQSQNTTQTTYRYNECEMPSFESATTLLTNSSWTIGGRTTTYAKYGTNSATEAVITLVDADGSTYGINGMLYTDATANKWQSNQPYTVSVWIYQSNVNPYDVTLNVGTGSPAAYIRNQQSVTQSLKASDGWQRLSLTYFPQENNQPLTIFINRAGGTIYLDGVLIEPSITLGDYFDGAYAPANTATVSYASGWDGVSNLSTSFLQILTTYSSENPDAIPFRDDGTDIGYQQLELAYGSETNNNRIQIINSAGTAIVSDPASIASYGIKTYTQDDNLSNTLAQATAIAYYYLDSMREPELRFNAISTQLENLTTADQQTVLMGEIWTPVEVTYTPSSVGSSYRTIQNIIGVQHSIQPDKHNVTFNLGSYGSRFILDSQVMGILDTSRLASG